MPCSCNSFCWKIHCPVFVTSCGATVYGKYTMERHGMAGTEVNQWKMPGEDYQYIGLILQHDASLLDRSALLHD